MSEGLRRTLAAIAVMLLLTGLLPLRRPAKVSGVAAAPREMAALSLPQGLIDVNTADAEELQSLYGVGETLAAAILKEREINGRFWYPEDLIAVRGIGEKTLARFYDMLDFSGD